MSMTISYDQDIIQRNKEWADNLNKYQEDKKKLEWGYNKKPDVITNKLIKQRDCVFNPVTQSYNDVELDSKLRQQDKNNMKEIISKNYDRSLRYEQTYNLINRDDKLKIFKSHPDYPSFKSDPIRTRLEKQRINYNILSNYTLDKHNFLKPELRPVIKENENTDQKKVNLNAFREYDIISNNYKVADIQKSSADKEIYEFEAAKKFWKTHDYNLITGKYYDGDKNQKMKNVVDFQTCKKHFEKYEE
jgi:hypothetical protein